MSDVSDVLQTTLDKTDADRLIWSRAGGNQPWPFPGVGLRKAVYRAATGELSLEFRAEVSGVLPLASRFQFSVRNAVKGEDQLLLPPADDGAAARRLRPHLETLYKAIRRNIQRQNEAARGKADDIVEALRKA
ncbi:MAG: hypothetical protein KKI08_24375 [Armatimonadetes bacterium]|nr:hypothetical protein [Armatimonadota bacterium]